MQDENVNSSLAVVLGFAVIPSLLLRVSHLESDHPPPPEELEI